MKNWVRYYQHTLKGDAKSEFEGEVERWISEGVFIHSKEEIKITAANGKARLVLNF